MKHIRSLILVLVLSAGLAPAFAQAPPPVPALPDAERRTSYVISGSTCVCAVGFQLYQDSTDVANWLTVYINGVQIPQPGNWNITSPSGSIATLPRPISNAVLTFTTARTGTVQIVGAQRPRRLSEYAENRGVAARDLNQVMNSIEAQLREIWDRQFRTVQAPPGETLNLLPVLANRANMGACFDANGMLTSCVAASSGSFAAGNGINFTGTNPTTISTATYAAGTGIQFTGTNPTVISASTTSTPFISTRAAATALDLHLFGVIQTGGYATAGDGGQGIFKNIGSAPFQDTSISNGSITAAGSAYTNGTYLGVALSGGTGVNAIATIVVSGNAVTSVTLTGTKGQGYSVSDVLTTAAANIGGTGSGFTWTVSALTSPICSFPDSIGTHFQIVIPPEGLDVRSCGAKVDWAGSDGGATNDFTAIQNAYNFASIPIAPTIDAGGTAGAKVLHPKGTSLVCGGSNTLLVPAGVSVEGQNMWASNLRLCDVGLNDGVHFMTICDPTTHLSCFASRLYNLTLSASATHSSLTQISMIYSNNIQQVDVLDRVAVYSGRRECIRFETGYGGAALLGMQNIECTPGNTTVNVGIHINYGTTLVTMRNVHVEGSSTINASGLRIQGGFVDLVGFHTEGVVTGIEVNIPIAGGLAAGIVRLHNLSGGTACTNLVLLQSTNKPGNTIVGQAIQNGCTNTVTNGQPTGSNVSVPIVVDTIFNP